MSPLDSSDVLYGDGTVEEALDELLVPAYITSAATRSTYKQKLLRLMLLKLMMKPAT